MQGEGNMIRNLLATTAIATLVTVAAHAQQQPAPAATDTTQPASEAAHPVQAEGFLASNIIGEQVYNGNDNNAEKIGKVNDLLLDKEGKTEGVIVGVGGFLGMGEHNVALEWTKLSWSERNGDRWLVYPSTKDQLQSLPEFNRKAYEPGATATTASNTVTDTAPATAQDTTAKPAATDTTKTGSIDKSQLTPIPEDKLLADKDLNGTTVYGVNDEKIGSIDDVILDKDGKKVDAVIVDVGGFLGMGAKPVAIGLEKLSFMADKDGNKYLYTPFTKDQLKAQPEFDKNSFAENRDKMLMKIQ
jgi:sporulation protein YlmC with PRC-barrel domain